jgi:hypothetical protein
MSPTKMSTPLQLQPSQQMAVASAGGDDEGECAAVPAREGLLLACCACSAPAEAGLTARWRPKATDQPSLHAGRKCAAQCSKTPPLSPVLMSTTCESLSVDLTLGWTNYRCTGAFHWDLKVKSDGTVITRGVIGWSQANSITIGNLEPDTLYTFSIGRAELCKMGRAGKDKCSRRQPSESVDVRTATFTAPSLGPAVVITLVDPDTALPSSADLVFTYSDFVCVSEDFTAEYVNAPKGWAGTVTPISAVSTVGWVVTQVPWGSVVDLEITTVASADPCCQQQSASSIVALSRELLIPMPPEPTASCSAIVLSVSVDDDLTGAGCIAFSWTSSSTYANGYDTQLTDSSGNVVDAQRLDYRAAGTTVTGLEPNSAYTFKIVGMCTATEKGSPASIPARTKPGVNPALLPFSIPTSFHSEGDGTLTATVAYQMPVSCFDAPTLSWGPGAPTGSVITKIHPGSAILPTKWTATKLAAVTHYTMNLKAKATSSSECSNECVGTNIGKTLTVSDAFISPLAPPTACASLPLTVANLPILSGCYCLTYTLASPDLASFVGGFDWTLTKGAVSHTTGHAAAGSTSIQVGGLFPGAAYQMAVTGICANGAKGRTVTAPNQTTGIPKASSLGTFVQAPSNPAFSSGPLPDKFATMVLTYPPCLLTCIDETTLELTWSSAPPAGTVITSPTPGRFRVTNVELQPSAYVIAFSLSGKAVGPGSDCGIDDCCNPFTAGDTISTTITITVPAGTTPPPTADIPFYLTLTNYAGPPKRFNYLATLEGPTAASVLGAGANTVVGSYFNQFALYQVYVTQFVEHFVKYQTQKQETFEGKTAYLHIDRIMWGVAGDPTVQGHSVPFIPPGKTFYETKRGYSFADSSSTINTPCPTPCSWKYPIISEFYLQMAIFNWECEKGTSSGDAYKNPSAVALGMNVYGSSRWEEEWWFGIEISGSGVISTKAPSNPKLQPSIVDGVADDGNGVPPAGTNPLNAGWNSLSRWIEYLAYVNQVLRGYIAVGKVHGIASAAMTLTDLTSQNAKFFQVSSITVDAEGNSFDNILYPDKPGVTSVPMPEINTTIKALWDKWINQTTSLPAGAPFTWWSTAAAANLISPAARSDGTTFFLPCCISSTKPNWFRDMADNDAGAPNFDAIDRVYQEIYDTSDSAPFRFIGASVADTETCGDAGLPKVSGQSFADLINPDGSVVSIPSLATDPYSEKPETFTGVWDNLIPTAPQCDNVLYINGSQISVQPASAQLAGAMTAYQRKGVEAMSPTLSTSQFDPWTSKLVWLPAGIHADVPDVDAKTQGWYLEGSRYDLYNGLMQAQISATSPHPRDVSVGAGADGGLLWDDLSTGLKPRTASKVKSLTSKTGLAANVWMLSAQCGPYVNTKGVRASARSTNTGNRPTADTMKFGCPDSELPAANAWPGWKGMRGQSYSPGGKNSAGVLQRYAYDQMELGPLDPELGKIVETGATEDNFGVFHDFGLMMQAYSAMAKELGGGGLNPHGITDGQAYRYTGSPYVAPGPPVLALYEIGFLPLSWFGGP